MLRPAALTAAICALSVAGSAGSAPPPAVAPHPVAVELFTSQGCAACPAADALLVRLSADPNVVAISRPVTYWDNQGWKDTLARPANTALQQAYTRRSIPGGGNYTPESVVQGRVGVIGGNEQKLRGTIAAVMRTVEPGIAITPLPGGGRVVALSGKPAKAARVSVVALRQRAVVEVRSGENGGRTLRYANVLIGERKVGSWAGGKASIAVPADAMKVQGADRYAVLVREGVSGPILAVRYL
jgi:hypothetical protein